jgi:hypothetical protein
MPASAAIRPVARRPPRNRVTRYDLGALLSRIRGRPNSAALRLVLNRRLARGPPVADSVDPLSQELRQGGFRQ